MAEPEHKKRIIPFWLKKLLEYDVRASKEFVEFVNKKYPSSMFRTHLKSLEVRDSSAIMVVIDC